MKILPNGVAVIEGDTHHAVWCAQQGLVHDQFAARILSRLIQKHGVKVCIDAGANIGTLTQVMLDAGCTVHAFEPNPQAIECLRHNCPGAATYEIALGSKSGSAWFTQLDNAGASFLSDSGQFKVKTAKLDDMRLCPGLIKIDVEGYEVALLEGASDTIKECRPVIVCEVNRGALERAGSSSSTLLNKFKEFGYNIDIAQPDADFDSLQYDIIAMPENRSVGKAPQTR